MSVICYSSLWLCSDRPQCSYVQREVAAILIRAKTTIILYNGCNNNVRNINDNIKGFMGIDEMLKIFKWKKGQSSVKKKEWKGWKGFEYKEDGDERR